LYVHKTLSRGGLEIPARDSPRALHGHFLLKRVSSHDVITNKVFELLNERDP